MYNTKCAICNSYQEYQILYKANFSLKRITKDFFSARRTPDRLHYQIVQCKKCQLIRSNPVIKPKRIKKLYKQGGLSYQEEIPNLRKTYGYYLDKIVKTFSVPKGRLLEIGCGNGFFLEEAQRQMFKKVVGVEPSSKIVESASKKILILKEKEYNWVRLLNRFPMEFTPYLIWGGNDTGEN